MFDVTPDFCIGCAKNGRLQPVGMLAQEHTETKTDEDGKEFKVCKLCGAPAGIGDTFSREDIIYVLWIAVAMMQEEDKSIVPEAVKLWLKIQGKEVGI